MKAIITQKSEMIEDGSVTVIYDIYSDAGETLYSNLQLRENASLIPDAIRAKMGEIKQQRKEANKINVGDEITL